MSIDDIEKSILANSDLSGIRQKNETAKAKELFADVCNHIAHARIRIKTGKRVLSASGPDGFDPIIELTGRDKKTNHPIEFLVVLNAAHYLQEGEFRTFGDSIINFITDAFPSHKSSHSRYVSRTEWLWFSQVFNELMRGEGIGYRLFYASEPSFYSKRNFSKSEILHKGEDYVELPSTGSLSFSVSNKGARGTLYFHLWYDV